MAMLEGVEKAAFVGSMMGIFGYYLGRYAARGLPKDEAVVYARMDLLRQTGQQVPSEKMQRALDGLIKFAEQDGGFKEDDDA